MSNTLKGGFTAQDVPNQKGKTIVITGANTGLGFEAAKVLAEKGARVIIGCRSEDKALSAIRRIKEANQDAELVFVPLDLSDLSSIRDCARELQAEEKIDVLINNAGIMIPPYQLTRDGFESQFGVNHLGHFALTALLLNKIDQADRGRIVNTSSHAHRLGKIDFEDLNAEKKYDANARYAMSKLCALYFTYELQRRLHKNGHSTIATVCHPGVASTELLRNPPAYAKFIQGFVRKLVNTPASGAWPTLCAATKEDVRGGDYYGPSKNFQTSGPATLVKSNKLSHNKENAKKLWLASSRLTGIDFAI